MGNPIETYLKDLKSDMQHAVENEECMITVTSKDVEKVEKLIRHNKRKQSELERNKDIRALFERKFINYRNKLLSIYRKTDDAELKAELKYFLEVEQKDVEFQDSKE